MKLVSHSSLRFPRHQVQHSSSASQQQQQPQQLQVQPCSPDTVPPAVSFRASQYWNEVTFDWDSGLRKRYRPLSALGVGSYGLVFSVWDVVLLQCVAIKFLKPRYSNITSATIQHTRYVREAVLWMRLSRLRCPEVVACYRAKVKNYPFLVLEQKRWTLSRWIQDFLPNRVPIELMKKVLQQIIRGLVKIHSSGVMHRDLTLLNILVSPGADREQVQASISDFGMACLILPLSSVTSRQSTPDLRMANGEAFASPRELAELQSVSSSGRRKREEKRHDKGKEREDKDKENNPKQLYCITTRGKNEDLDLQFLLQPPLDSMKESHIAHPRPVPLRTEILTQKVTAKPYRAPEVLLGKTYTEAIDMWAVGVVFAEMLLQERLWKGANGSEAVQLEEIYTTLGTPDRSLYYHQHYRKFGRYYVKEHLKPRTSAWCKKFGVDHLGADLLRGLLEFNPDKRLTAQEALRHEWFENPTEAKLSHWDGDGEDGQDGDGQGFTHASLSSPSVQERHE